MTFDPNKYLTEKQKLIQPELPEEVSPSEAPLDVSKTESALRGAAQGLSLGTADEITGAISAAKEQGINPIELYNDPNALENLLQSYRKHRDESRSAYKKAEEANPLTYTGGNIVGSIAPVVATGGGGVIANIGKAAVLGGITGAGTSEADLTKPSKEQLKELGKDVAIGSTIGGASAGIGEGIKQLGKFGLGKTIKEAYEQGKKGNILVGEEARSKINKEIVDYAEQAEKQLQQKIKENAIKQGEILEKATVEGKRILVAPLQEMAEEEISKMPKAFGEAKKGRQELRKLFTEAADESQLGEDFIKSAGEAIDRGAKITEVLQAGGELNPKDFIGFKRALSRLGYEKDLKDDQVVALAKRLSGKASDIAEENIPELTDVNKKISALKKAQETFNVSGMAEDEIANVKKVSTLLEQLEKENLGSEVTRRKFAKAIEEIRSVYPEIAEKYEKDFFDLAKKTDVAKKIAGSDSLYTRHLLKGLGTAGANVAGVGVNKMKLQPAIDAAKGLLKTVPQSGMIQTADDINKEKQPEEPKQTPSKDHSRNLYNMNNDDLVATLDSASQNAPQLNSSIEQLKQAIQDGDMKRKDRLLFSLVQNPIFRKETSSEG